MYGVIAQLIRALPLQGRGPGFESQLLHHRGRFRGNNNAENKAKPYFYFKSSFELK